MKRHNINAILAVVIFAISTLSCSERVEVVQPQVSITAPLKSAGVNDVSHPVDFFCLYNSTGNTITWVVKSLVVLNPVYNIYYNGLWNSSGTWKSGYPIVVSVDGLTIGSYNVTIIASNDASSNMQDTVFVFVVENGLPDLTRPENLTCNTDELVDIVLSWTITDITTSGTPTFLVLVDDYLVLTGTWCSRDTVTFPLETIIRGNHTITIMVNDGSGNYVKDEVQVNVVFPPNDLPVVISSGNLVIVTGFLGSKVSWFVFDHVFDNATYSIFQDNRLVASGTWTSGMEIFADASQLSPGSYDFLLLVDDGLGGKINNSIALTVNDLKFIDKTTAFFVNSIPYFIMGAIISSFFLLNIAIKKMRYGIRSAIAKQKAKNAKQQRMTRV
jgi:hypothetical protein